MSKKFTSKILLSALLCLFFSIQIKLSAQPANDHPCDAIVINCDETLSGTTVGASLSELGTVNCSGGSLRDVFYTFQATTNEEYTVSVNGEDYDGVLVIYSGNCTGDLEELYCQDQGVTEGVEESISFSVSSPSTIYIRTYDYFVSAGSFEVSLTCSIPASTPCEAIELSCNETIIGSTANAIPSSTPPTTCSGTNTYRDMYYSFYTLPYKEYFLEVNGLNIDAVITLYTGDCDGELTEYACINNEETINSAESYSFSTSEQTAFLLRIYDNSQNEGEFELTFNCNLINEDPCGAQSIMCGDTIVGSNVGASPSGMPAPTCANGTLEDVFYQFDALPQFDYHIEIVGGNYGAVLAAYTGMCDGELIELACADDGIYAGIKEELFISVDVPQTIILRTYDFSTSQGSFQISLNCVENYDCPLIEANFGDSCDDENINTLNDLVENDCSCLGQYENGALSGGTTWSSSCGNRDINLYFFDQNTNEIAASYTTTLTADGNFSIPEVLAGTFNIYAKIDGHLQKEYNAIYLESSMNNLNLGQTVAGDINNDNIINIVDFSISSDNFGRTIDSPNFNQNADLNCDGLVNIVDFSILNARFGLTGSTP